MLRNVIIRVFRGGGGSLNIIGFIKQQGFIIALFGFIETLTGLRSIEM
jgi:hypothetical protein